MSKQIHQWTTFYSPRNGRITIQACAICGIAKGMVYEGYKCESEKKHSRLKGWTTVAPEDNDSNATMSEMLLSA